MANAEAVAQPRRSRLEASKVLVLRGGYTVQGPSAEGGIHESTLRSGGFVRMLEIASRVTLKAMRSEAFCGLKDRRNFWRSTSSSKISLVDKTSAYYAEIAGSIPASKSKRLLPSGCESALMLGTQVN